MESVNSINSVKEKLNRVVADLNKYNVETFKDTWKDNACEEFVIKLQNVYNIIDEIQDELNTVETCIGKSSLGE